MIGINDQKTQMAFTHSHEIEFYLRFSFSLTFFKMLILFTKTKQEEKIQNCVGGISYFLRLSIHDNPLPSSLVVAKIVRRTKGQHLEVVKCERSGFGAAHEYVKLDLWRDSQRLFRRETNFKNCINFSINELWYGILRT